MKISVALATYNGEKYIEAQLESILHQTLPPDEVIICDDCSSDGTVLLTEQYIARNGLSGWSLVRNDENLGPFANFRKAVSLCTGDLIFTCDQDDIWLPEKIQRTAELIADNPQVKALACNYTLIDENGITPEAGFRPLYKRAARWKRNSLHKIRGKVLYGNVAQGCACAYRKELTAAYLKRQYPSNFPHDWALNLTALENGGLYYYNEKLLQYRIHGENTTGVISNAEAFENRVNILEKYTQDMKTAADSSTGFPEKYQRAAEFTELRIRLLKNGKLSEFGKGFLKYPELAFGYFFLSFCKDACSVLKHSGSK